MNPEIEWSRKLSEVTERLSEQNQISPDIQYRVEQGIKSWKADKEHGAEHASFVLSGALWLAKQESVKISPRLIESAAMLHDVGQFLPLESPTGQVSYLAGSSRTRHAQMMAVLIRRYGEDLQLNQEESRQVAEAVRVHDDVLLSKVHPNLTPLAQILSDADELFSSSQSREPKQLAQEIIERNMRGFNQPEGWYLLRDLSQSERDSWQYGDRWLRDSVSAIRHHERYHYYTRTAQNLARTMQQAMPHIASDIYGELYEHTQEWITVWNSSTDSDKKVWLVGKEQGQRDVTRQDSLANLIHQAYQQELPLPEKYQRNGSARGWKLILETSGQTHLIDPSIARFTTKESFLSGIRTALR